MWAEFISAVIFGAGFWLSGVVIGGIVSAIAIVLGANKNPYNP